MHAPLTLPQLLLGAFSLVFTLVLCVLLVKSLCSILAVKRFEDGDPPEPPAWPRLSVIIAALNEAESIRGAVATLLEQDYPDLELVIVDDRSTDGTGAIIRELATSDARIKALRVDELPAGWLGKVHALHVAASRATGEWLLFTDADIHFHTGTLRRAVARCLARDADHLVVFPFIEVRSFWLALAVQTFLIGYLELTRAAHLGRPGSKAFVGAGAFNLVRKAALDATEGFSWLRMEVGDDVGLGLMLSRSGARSEFAFGTRHVRMTFYPSLKATARGLEKNGFAGARYSLPRLLVITLLAWGVSLAPLVALSATGVAWLWPAGALCLALLVALGLLWRRKLGVPVLPVVLLPLGNLVMSLIFVRSGFLCWRRGGIAWRGTFYPVAALKEGQRVKL